MLDWLSIQAALFQLATADLQVFAAEHKSERFYGLFVDCNAYYGDVLLHLNTPEMLHRQAQTYKHNIQSIGGSAISPELYADKTIGQIEEELRWSGGDWGYFEVNRSDEWQKRWEPIRKSIAALAENGHSFEDAFMKMACRVLLEIEWCGVLDLLQRTDDFRTLCADRDEGIEHAARRLEAVRAEAAGS